jgi:hypothetical protein
VPGKPLNNHIVRNGQVLDAEFGTQLDDDGILCLTIHSRGGGPKPITTVKYVKRPASTTTRRSIGVDKPLSMATVYVEPGGKSENQASPRSLLNIVRDVTASLRIIVTPSTG